MRNNTSILISILRLAFLLPSILFVIGTARAATFTVNLPHDAGDLTCDATCTLRDAVDDARFLAGDDTINFAAGLTTITLTDEINIGSASGAIVINGLGANVLTIDGGAGTNRIFYIGGSIVTIRDVTLTGGDGTGNFSFDGFGGAIYVLGVSLTLERVHITGNSAAVRGGGVFYNAGTNHRIRHSTLSANTSGGCGGFATLSSSVRVVNSTISGNTATGASGGGFCQLSQGTTTLRNVTVTGNNANNGGGGFYNQDKINFGNTIVAGNNSTTGNPEIYSQFGTITSAGNNLVGDSAGEAQNTGLQITYQGTDILNTPPMLGALQNNGGTTPTHALLMGSPAIDAGGNALAVDPFDGSPLLTDQRGYARIEDAPPLSSPVVDIGAFELHDPDGDGVDIALDNCPNIPNPDQTDNDNDGQGNDCDPDDDNDGQTDADETACGSDPLNADSRAADNDADNSPDCVDVDDDNDGVADTNDNCQFSANPDQANNDGDSQGDVCDSDDDNDGIADGADNCPLNANADQADNDNDGQGNVCDADDDNDGVVDTADNCPLVSNPNQVDTNNDGIGDACDPDNDNDGVADSTDNCPLTPNPDQADFDLDGIGDACDAQTGPPTNRDQCRNGGWIRFDTPRRFRNQGDCIRFVNTSP